jgi:hypothetical protein
MSAALASLGALLLSAASSPSGPLPAPGATVSSSSTRITALRDGLFRLQLGRPADLVSTQATRRPAPW